MKARFPSSPKRFVAAFSLFEIVVAMSILGLIAGSVLAIVWQAGDTAADIRYLDQRDEEVNTFIALLRESIENLPSGATLSMTPAEESITGYNELKIENSPTAFVFGEMVGASEETIIALRPTEDPEAVEPTFEVAISRSDFAPDDEDGDGMVFRASEEDFLQADQEGRYWLTLLTGISAASWRFWDGDQNEWLTEWTDDDAMPPLLELTLADTGEMSGLRVVFEIPESAVNPDEAAATTTTTTSSSGSSGGGDRNRGGDGDRGDGGRGDRGDGNRGDGRGSGDRGDRPGGGDRPGIRPGGPGGRPGGGGSDGGNRGGGGGQAPSGGGGGNR